MREKWLEHSPSTNLITHGTEGENSGFGILRHQTLPLPGPNVDFISERIKAPGSFPVGLAAWPMIHMPDHMPLKDSVWSSVFSRALIQVSGFILTIVTKNKAFVMEMNALTIGHCESANLNLKPWFTLVSESGSSNMWYSTRIPWPILGYFCAPPGWVYLIFKKAT